MGSFTASAQKLSPGVNTMGLDQNQKDGRQQLHAAATQPRSPTICTSRASSICSLVHRDIDKCYRSTPNQTQTQSRPPTTAAHLPPPPLPQLQVQSPSLSQPETNEQQPPYANDLQSLRTVPENKTPPHTDIETPFEMGSQPSTSKSPNSKSSESTTTTFLDDSHFPRSASPVSVIPEGDEEGDLADNDGDDMDPLTEEEKIEIIEQDFGVLARDGEREEIVWECDGDIRRGVSILVRRLPPFTPPTPVYHSFK